MGQIFFSDWLSDVKPPKMKIEGKTYPNMAGWVTAWQIPSPPPQADGTYRITQTYHAM